MEKKYKYRTLLYADYNSHLEDVALIKDKVREKKLISKYFKVNYLPHFPDEKEISIVDIGCGKGAYLSACIENGYLNVRGVDLSESNVEYCNNNRIPCSLVDGYDFLEENPGKFDIILFTDVIEHLLKDELIEMIAVMREALRENGIIIVKTNNLSNPFTGAAVRYSDFTHETGFTEQSLRQVFRAMGFTNINIYGAKIYIYNNPIFWVVALFERISSGFLFLHNCLYGRTSVRIFTKNIIGVIRK